MHHIDYCRIHYASFGLIAIVDFCDHAYSNHSPAARPWDLACATRSRTDAGQRTLRPTTSRAGRGARGIRRGSGLPQIVNRRTNVARILSLGVGANVASSLLRGAATESLLLGLGCSGRTTAFPSRVPHLSAVSAFGFGRGVISLLLVLASVLVLALTLSLRVLG